MRPFLQKRLIDLLPSSRGGADAGGDGEQGAGEVSGGSKKRKAAKGGEEEQEGEEEEEEATTTANAAAAGGVGGGAASQLKGCDVFSALLKVCGYKMLPHRGERGGEAAGGGRRAGAPCSRAAMPPLHLEKCREDIAALVQLA